MAVRKLGGIALYILLAVLFGTAFATTKIHASPYGDNTYGQCPYGQSCSSSGSSGSGSSSSGGDSSSQSSTSDDTNSSDNNSTSSNITSNAHNDGSASQTGGSNQVATGAGQTTKPHNRTLLVVSLALIALAGIIWWLVAKSRRRNKNSDF